MSPPRRLTPASLRSGSIEVPDEVVHRDFGSETIVLHLGTGNYHGLNPTGARMLEALRESGSVALAATRIADEVGVSVQEVERDLLDFCRALAERGLLTVAPR